MERVHRTGAGGGEEGAIVNEVPWYWLGAAGFCWYLLEEHHRIHGHVNGVHVLLAALISLAWPAVLVHRMFRRLK